MIVKHPNPFQVAWASKTILPVTERCLVPIQTGDYKDKIYCDVLPMDVARILLGHLWFYNLDVIKHGWENSYSFKYKGKNVIFRLAKPQKKDGKGKSKPSPQVPMKKPSHNHTSVKKDLHVLTKQKFEKAVLNSKCWLEVKAREVPSDSFDFKLETPHEVLGIFCFYSTSIL